MKIKSNIDVIIKRFDERVGEIWSVLEDMMNSVKDGKPEDAAKMIPELRDLLDAQQIDNAKIFGE